MRLTQKQEKIKFRAKIKVLHNDTNVLPTLAKKPDNYFSGGKQPVQVLTAEITQPRLKRPEGGLNRPEMQNRFWSSKDKQREINNQNQFQH